VASRPDFVQRHPATLDPAPPGLDRAPERPPTPQLVTAGLVLMAAAAVLEGYRWLHVIPSSRLHPSALVFAVLMVPAAAFLARPPHGWTRTPAQQAALVAGAGLVVVTVVYLLAGRPWSAGLLGAYDLAMAATLVAAAVMGADSFANAD